MISEFTSYDTTHFLLSKIKTLHSGFIFAWLNCKSLYRLCTFYSSSQLSGCYIWPLHHCVLVWWKWQLYLSLLTPTDT